ncbi:hypothetical protein BSLG_000542 [Batrachochytrium salamandrivorans]|nr:hypothetical protein BSLG_000542 [Batrachochytrium salamandrivorans]
MTLVPDSSSKEQPPKLLPLHEKPSLDQLPWTSNKDTHSIDSTTNWSLELLSAANFSMTTPTTANNDTPTSTTTITINSTTPSLQVKISEREMAVPNSSASTAVQSQDNLQYSHNRRRDIGDSHDDSVHLELLDELEPHHSATTTTTTTTATTATTVLPAPIQPATLWPPLKTCITSLPLHQSLLDEAAPSCGTASGLTATDRLLGLGSKAYHPTSPPPSQLPPVPATPSSLAQHSSHNPHPPFATLPLLPTPDTVHATTSNNDSSSHCYQGSSYQTMHPAPASVTSDRQPRLEFPNNHRNARVQQIRASPPIAATVPPSNQVHNPLFRCPSVVSYSQSEVSIAHSALVIINPRHTAKPLLHILSQDEEDTKDETINPTHNSPANMHYVVSDLKLYDKKHPSKRYCFGLFSWGACVAFIVLVVSLVIVCGALAFVYTPRPLSVSILGPDSSFSAGYSFLNLSSGTDPATAMQSGSFPFTAKLSMGLSVKVDSSNMLTLLFDSASFSGSILDPSNGNWLTIGPTFSFTGDAYGVKVPQGPVSFYWTVNKPVDITDPFISAFAHSCTPLALKSDISANPKTFQIIYNLILKKQLLMWSYSPKALGVPLTLPCPSQFVDFLAIVNSAALSGPPSSFNRTKDDPSATNSTITNSTVTSLPSTSSTKTTLMTSFFPVLAPTSIPASSVRATMAPSTSWTN